MGVLKSRRALWNNNVQGLKADYSQFSVAWTSRTDTSTLRPCMHCLRISLTLETKKYQDSSQ